MLSAVKTIHQVNPIGSTIVSVGLYLSIKDVNSLITLLRP